MDVDCPARNNAVTLSDVATTMEAEASEGHNSIIAIECSMELVDDGQVARGIPEVQIDDDDGDVGFDMDIDSGAITTQSTDTVIRVNAFRQAARNGWKWIR